MRVLFIGNSHTFFNDMPQTFKKLAESAGFPTEVEMIAHGGRPLSWHLQEIVRPGQGDSGSDFDPLDKDQVDLSDILEGRE